MSGFRSIKGTFDVLPYGGHGEGAQSVSSASWVEAESTIRSVFEHFDFDEIRTPVIEPAELIARGVGEHTDIVTKEMFAFSRGSDNYVLRPEITAPVVRAFLQNSMQQHRDVHRLFYIGPCFRAERPQKGRYRQFHQFGCEVIGSDDPRTDADVIVSMLAIYQAFGLSGFRLRLNSLGNPDSRKKYSDALRSYFDGFRERLSETSRNRLAENPLRILDTKNPAEQELLENAPRMTEFISDDDRAHFSAVRSLLDDLDVTYEIDPLLVRGLDYYTRTAFELEIDTLGAQSALAGGGRYDLLAQELGARSPVPAVGFAAGFERLFLALEAIGTDLEHVARPDIYFVALGETAERACYRLAQQARAVGLRVTFDVGGRSMKGQMRDANKREARYAVIIGDHELADGSAQIKNMANGDELTVSLDQIASKVKGLTNVSETS
ncbi:MAG: histidine--tRNA ligase [Candidatus Latescibacterota bacterium]|jgi:histidyl-tRNA synthetase